MTWSPPVPVVRDSLITRALRPFGHTADTELRTVAGDLLDETVMDMNMHLYEFNRMTTSIALTSGTIMYQLPSPFYRESLAYLVKIADSEKQAPFVYIPNVRFRSLPGVGYGVPYLYTLRNVHADGLVEVAPTPNDDCAAKYTLSIEYYRRIVLPSEATGGQLDVPQEVEVPLMYGTQKRLAIHFHGPGHPDVGGYKVLEDEALGNLKGVDKRHPDQHLRFVLSGHSTRGAYTVGGGGAPTMLTGGGAAPRTATSLAALGNGQYPGEAVLVKVAGQPTLVYIWVSRSVDDVYEWELQTTSA